MKSNDHEGDSSDSFTSLNTDIQNIIHNDNSEEIKSGDMIR